jgi:3-methyl-2-oxobutanoate hydroxymethyltransferase
MTQRVTAPVIAASKGGRRLSMVTAYDYCSARLADEAGLDMILVGDSLAMVVLGHEDTLSVTMDEMLHHVRAVSRGAKRALVVADMPFMSYHAGVESAVANAGRYLKEAGARAVKVEGAGDMLPKIAAMAGAQIPVLGHLGLTPQSIARLGGFKVQAKTAEAARLLTGEALSLVDAGCFAIVLEAVPAAVAAEVTRAVSVPTIGIGAGPGCDGQVLVYHDMLGLYDKFQPKFVKRYAELGVASREALERYKAEVESGAFPGPEHSFAMIAGEEAKLKDAGP